MSAGPAITIEGVTKRFGDLAAVSDLSTTIAPGKLTGLAGPDGAGKTTLMRLMAGLLYPEAGTLNVAGLDTRKDREALPLDVGYMPQRFGLYEDLSVLENMELYADLRDLDRKEAKKTFDRLLDFTRLGPFQKRLAGALSGGMKQKLGLACALMGAPKVLLLDEPGVGVDPVSRQELWAMVQDLTGGGMAVIWSTAYLDEAERCEHVLLMNEGKLVFEGAPETLTRKLEGRSFRMTGEALDRRRVLSDALNLESVCDGVIQGAGLRIVLDENAPRTDIDTLARDNDALLSAVPPRFEDAFIDLLGGGPGGTSAIAERMDQVSLDSPVAVSCSHLTKAFGSFKATDDVSFEVKPGEIFGLLGPNGAGKSTTFKMLCGLMKPTSGEAKVVGYDLAHAPGQAKAQLGYMAQKFSLYGLLSVKQNLDFSAGVYGLAGARKRERIEEMVETFQLGPFLNASPADLSLGYKQRLALSCALMHRPPVLFLDEPTSGVDPITRREFWTHINGLVRKGVTVMVTTHFMDEAEYCDRVALMYRGKIIALDDPDTLKASTQSTGTPDPTMEEAFIHLIEQADADDAQGAAA